MSEMSFLELPEDIQGRLLNVLPLETICRISCCSKAATSIWTVITALEIPRSVWRVLNQVLEENNRSKVLQFACNNLLKHCKRLAEIKLRCGFHYNILNLAAAPFSLLVSVDIRGAKNEQTAQLLPLLRCEILQHVGLLYHPSLRLNFELFFAQHFPELRTIKISSPGEFFALLQLLSAERIPKVKKITLSRSHSLLESPLWENKSAFVKFMTMWQPDQVPLISLNAPQLTFDVRKLLDMDPSPSKVKEICDSARKILGIPLTSFCVSKFSVLPCVCGKIRSEEDFISAFTSFYDIGTTPTPVLARREAERQCRDLMLLSDSLPRTDSLLMFLSQQRNRILSQCPSPRSGTEERPSQFIRLCIDLVCRSEGSQTAEESFQCVLECLERNPLFWVSIISLPFQQKFLQLIAQESPLRLNRLIPREFAPKVFDLLGYNLCLTKDIVEFCASKIGPLRFHSILTTLERYIMIGGRSHAQSSAVLALIKHSDGAVRLERGKSAVSWITDRLLFPKTMNKQDSDILSAIIDQIDLMSAPYKLLSPASTPRQIVFNPYLRMDQYIKLFRMGFMCPPRKLIDDDGKISPFRGNRDLIALIKEYSEMVHVANVSTWVHEDLWLDVIKTAQTPQQLFDWADTVYDVYGQVPQRILQYIGGFADLDLNPQAPRFPSAVPDAHMLLQTWCRQKGIKVVVLDEAAHVEDELSASNGCTLS